MHFKTKGLVLRQTEYKDNDKLLTVLTQDFGRMTMKARGVKSRSSKLKSGCQLLAYSEFTVFENKGMCTIDEANPLELFLPLRDDLEQLCLASYFAQVTEMLAQEDSPNPELLSLTLNCLYALSRLQKPQLQVKAAFELSAACIAGYEPALDGCAVCQNAEPDRFHVQQGVLLCAGCQGQEAQGLRMPLRPGTLAAMRHIVYGEKKQLFQFRASEEILQELSGLTETYLTMQLEQSFYTLDFYKSVLKT